MGAAAGVQRRAGETPMLNPLRSEGEAFRLLLYALVVFVVIVVIVVVVRAV